MWLPGKESDIVKKKTVVVSVRGGDRLCVCVREKERGPSCVLLIIHES